jgi:hypothetical protein
MADLKTKDQKILKKINDGDSFYLKYYSEKKYLILVNGSLFSICFV